MAQKHMVISMIAPVAVAGILIMAILAATVNAQESNNTGNAQQQSNNTENAQVNNSTENATSPSESMVNNATSPSESMVNNATSPSESMVNNATSPSESMASNKGNEHQESNSNMTAVAPNIGNARQESNNTGNATSTGGPENATSAGMSTDLANGILTLMNQERAAVNASGNVPPLVWNDTAAAHAKDWAEYLAAGKTGTLGITHCIFVPGWEQIESCTHHEGENLVWYSPHNANRSAADYLNFWLSEKKDYHGGPPSFTAPVTGHYTQIVWNTTKSVGCGIAVSPPEIHNGDIMSCRFYPAGNLPRPPY